MEFLTNDKKMIDNSFFFIASYYRKLFADIKINNLNIKPVLIKAQANKTGINFMIFILIFVENCLLYDGIHHFTVWM